MQVKNTTRIGLYKDLLASSNYFKLVCGAGNEDKTEIEYLTYIYTLAGCSGFDVSANPEIVLSAKKGINEALRKAKELEIELPFEPFITISIGLPGDHHVRKAFISDNCVACNLCIPACPTNAIPNTLKIKPELCIGCGDCEAACPPAVQAIAYKHDTKELNKILPSCLEAGAESIELHAGVADNESTMKEWENVSNYVPNGLISMCLDRKHLSNDDLIFRIKSAMSIAGERLIIQADGIPMSGGNDNYNTTLQAVSIADIINKELKQKIAAYKDLPLLISGGTNSFTGSLARQCGVAFNGISIGRHARKAIIKYKKSPSEITNENLLGAVANAKILIEKNLYCC